MDYLNSNKLPMADEIEQAKTKADNNDIEELQQELKEIDDSLEKFSEELKNNNSLPEDEKKKQSDTLKTKMESLKQKIDNVVALYKEAKDDEGKKKFEEAEALSSCVKERMDLYASILNTGEAKKEGFLGRQREKLKENPGKYILNITGLAAVGLGIRQAWKWLSKKRKKKKEESASESDTKEATGEKEKKGFWERPVGKTIKTVGSVVGSVLAVGSVGYYVTHGIVTKNRGLKDLWDRERGKKLEFDAAMEYCKGAISNQNNKEGMAYGMDLKYHEETGEIEAYGERVKINKNARKIEGLDVSFKKYENMINTAIVIAFLKKNYAGRCATDAPFDFSGPWKGNVDVNIGRTKETAVDGSGILGKVVGISSGGIAGIVSGIFGGPQIGATVGIVGGIAGLVAGHAVDVGNIMHDHMPELDNEHGKKSLAGYLNKMNCRKERNQEENDITESPIKDKVREFVNEIQKENPDLPAEGGRRKFDAIQDPNDEKKYIIKAYGREISAEITGTNGNEKMKILGISGGVPAIKTDMTKGNISDLEVPLKEGLYMTAILGEFLEKYHHKCKSTPYFKITWKAIKSHTAVITRKLLNGESLEKALENGGLYINDTERSANPFSRDFWKVDTLIYPNKYLKKNMPTIFNKENSKNFLEFLNEGITDENNISIWKK